MMDCQKLYASSGIKMAVLSFMEMAVIPFAKCNLDSLSASHCHVQERSSPQYLNRKNPWNFKVHRNNKAMPHI